MTAAVFLAHHAARPVTSTCMTQVARLTTLQQVHDLRAYWRSHGLLNPARDALLTQRLQEVTEVNSLPKEVSEFDASKMRPQQKTGLKHLCENPGITASELGEKVCPTATNANVLGRTVVSAVNRDLAKTGYRFSSKGRWGKPGYHLVKR